MVIFLRRKDLLAPFGTDGSTDLFISDLFIGIY